MTGEFPDNNYPKEPGMRKVKKKKIKGLQRIICLPRSLLTIYIHNANLYTVVGWLHLTSNERQKKVSWLCYFFFKYMNKNWRQVSVNFSNVNSTKSYRLNINRHL